MPHHFITIAKTMSSVIKTVGRSGQIALGKQFAGRHVLVTEIEPGVWTVKLGEFIPDSERWLHKAGTAQSLDRAIDWAEQNPPAESDLDALERELSH
jgi:hypothetical protein